MTSEHVLEAVGIALEEGRFEEALALLEDEPASGEAEIYRSTAWFELDELERAQAALARAEELLPSDDTWLKWAASRLRIREWRIGEAKALLDDLRGTDQDPWALEGLALIADLEGDHDRADELVRELADRYAGEHPLPPRVSPDAFHELVAQAADRLDAPFRAAFEEISVIIDPMPTAEVLEAPGSGHGPDTLGLFVGHPFGEEASEMAPAVPRVIFLFQRNLERVCTSTEELEEEVAVTLYHELGHALGFDEEGVDAMGLG